MGKRIGSLHIRTQRHRKDKALSLHSDKRNQKETKSLLERHRGKPNHSTATQHIQSKRNRLLNIFKANGIDITPIEAPQTTSEAERAKYYELKLRKELQNKGFTLVKTHNFLETWTQLSDLCRAITAGEAKYDLIVIDSVTAQYVGYLMKRKMEAMMQTRGDWRQKQQAGRRAMFNAVSDCQAFMVAVINELHQLAGQEKFVVLMTGQPKSEVSDILKGGVGEQTADTAAGEGGNYTGGKAVEFPPKTVIRLEEQSNEVKMAIIESHRNVKPGQIAIFKTTERGVE